MADLPGTTNAAAAITGALVQAGSIDRLTLNTGRTSPSVPRQLPPAVRGFIGRTEHLATLDSLLSEHSTAGAVVISALDGTAGVGKTALVVHWAHRVQHQFPDGTLHVNLRGYGPGDPATPAEVLDGFLRALGCTPEQIPIGLEAQAALYRSLVANRRMLIVLDNANAPEQVRPLLPASPGSLVLITSRASLTGLVISLSAIRVTLDVLDPAEAVDLVRDVVGRHRAESEPDAVVDLTRMCARLPLALRIAASRVALRRHLSISDVLADMAGETERLDLLSSSGDETTAVRAVFDWSYRQLTEQHARMFRRLGLHPGSEVSVHAAAAVAELPERETEKLLEELAEIHLLEPVAKARYRFHDLLRAYAADRARDDDSPGDRQRAMRTLLEWYIQTAIRADPIHFTVFRWHFQDHHDPVHSSLFFLNREEGLRWLTAERANLVAAAHRSAEHGFHRLAMRLTDAVSCFLLHEARWDDLAEIQHLGLTSAQDSGDRAAEASFLVWRSELSRQRHGLDQAFEDARAALSIVREVEHGFMEAAVLNQLGLLYLARQEYSTAAEYLSLALPLSDQADDGRMKAVILGNLGSVQTRLGHYELAIEYAGQGVVIRQHIGDRAGESFALWQLAAARQGAAQHAEAARLCENALVLGREYSYPLNTAQILDTLGASWRALGNSAQAISAWREALEIYELFNDQRGHELRERLNELVVTQRSGH